MPIQGRTLPPASRVHTTPHLRRLLLVLAVIGAFLVTAPSAGAAEIGIVGDITWTDSRADIDREVELAQAAGVRWIRTNVNWKGLEGDGKGQINTWLLAQYDYAIDKAHAAGLEVLMPISDGIPYWASGDPRKSGGRYNDTYPPANMADYGDIVRYVVKHFNARGVRAYEIWNEPNIERFWASGPNPAEYVEMLKQGYNAVKAVDPNATVVLGGLSRNDFSFLEGIYRAGGGRYFDAAAVHPYTYGVKPATTWNGVNGGEDPDRLSWNSFPALKEVKSTMDANGDSHKQVWITEFGYTTTSEDGGVSEAQQAEYLTQAYRYVENLPWVHSLFWYSARNAPFDNDADSYESRFGLMTTDFRLKPSYFALKQYAESVGSPRPAPTPPPPAGVAAGGRTQAPVAATKLPVPDVKRRSPSGGSRGKHTSVRVRGSVPARVAQGGRLRLHLERYDTGKRAWQAAPERMVAVFRGRYERVLHRGQIGRGRWRVSVVAAGSDGNVIGRSRNRYFRL